LLGRAHRSRKGPHLLTPAIRGVETSAAREVMLKLGFKIPIVLPRQRWSAQGFLALTFGAVAGGAGGVEGFPCGGVAAKQGGGGDWGLEGRGPGRGVPHGFIIREREGHGPHDVPVFVPFRGAPPASPKGPQLIFDVPRR